MAYQLEKKALNKVKTISATDYVALINNVEKQKNAGNVLITWRDFLAEVGLDLNYIQNLTIDQALVTNIGISSTIFVNSISEFNFGNGVQLESPVRYTQGQQFLSGIAGAVDVTSQTTVIDTTAGVAAYTLADGLVGQEKFIYLGAGGNNAVITPSNLLGYTTIDLGNIGDSVTLWFNGGNWVVKATAGGTTIS